MKVSSSGEAGDITGTKDKDYNLIWFTKVRLSNALRLDRTSWTPTEKGTATLRNCSARRKSKARRAPNGQAPA